MLYLAPKTLGPKSDPWDVKQLRSESYDYHRRYGFPVYFKHAWNELDVEKGLAERCPYCYDRSYLQGRQWDPYCFGTGYLGGFKNGEIVYLTISDASEDIVKPNEAGVLMLEKHSIVKAPWTPYMGDGDLIIEVVLDPRDNDVVSYGDRFLLKQVEPMFIRGSGRDGGPFNKFRVSQAFQVDRLPFGHQFYQTPITFTYTGLPTPPDPVGLDPERISTPLRAEDAPEDVNPFANLTYAERAVDFKIKVGAATPEITVVLTPET